MIAFPRVARAGAVLAALLTLTACEQRMAHPPSYRPLTETDFYPDRRSSRPIEDGTVHRAQILDDDPLGTGLTADGKKVQSVSIPGTVGNTMTVGAGIPNKTENFVAAFPFKVDRKDLERGQERYQIYCVPCHGPLGDGRGKIWERGYLAPPSFHLTADPELLAKDARHGRSRGFNFYGVKGADGQPLALRDVPVGYIYEIITKGYGGMPDYAAQIAPADRWRVAAYVKALMVSQNAGQAGALKLNAAQWADVENQLGGRK